MFDCDDAFRSVLLKLDGVVERWIVGVKGKGKERPWHVNLCSLTGGACDEQRNDWRLKAATTPFDEPTRPDPEMDVKSEKLILTAKGVRKTLLEEGMRLYRGAIYTCGSLRDSQS